MKYSKKDRETAALICAISASNPEQGVYANVAFRLGLTSDEWDTDPAAVQLACHAWVHTRHTSSPHAEAHSLIMSGWSPGDEP